MFEKEPLINKAKVTIENFHTLAIEKLLAKLSTTTNGLTSALAKEKRDSYGLNHIKAPVTAPAWLCCLLPCLLNTSAMKKYNECVAEYGFVKRNGRWVKLDSLSIVPGDIVRIGKGERVPADVRILKVILADK